MNATLSGSHYTGSMWQPPTPWMERIQSEDERTSLELSLRLGLRSAKGWTPPEPVRHQPEAPVAPCAECGKPLRPGQTSEFCNMACRKRNLRRKGLMGREKAVPYSSMATRGIRVRMGVLSKMLRADNGNRSLLVQLGELSAELKRRAG